jgi:aspartyl-tRNA(Asn)/glutamyl-tRNA(Gln) amidotransferase subunit A
MKTIHQAGAALRSGATTSVALTRECLDTIEQLQPRLNAFITVTAEQAMEQAAARDAELAAGEDRGPLHGIPIALKDMFEVKGVRNTVGSKIFADWVSDTDSAAWEKLDAAGCVLVGKTGMHELAYGITSNNAHYGAVRNPHDPERIPGGSSGGSGAAVAAGMCYMAMGTDTGGSVRIPAAYCGTVGLKATFGRVSTHGVLPLGFSLDHAGPLTRSVRDAATCLQVLAGYDPRDANAAQRFIDEYDPPAEADLPEIRIGVPRNYYFERVDTRIADAVLELSERAAAMGAEVKTVDVPDIAGLNTVGRVILLAEAAAALEPYLDRRADFGAEVLPLLDQGRLVSAIDYVQAQRLRRKYQLEFAKLFESIDCLLTPMTPLVAPKIGEATVEINGEPEDARLASTRFARGINVIGLPALAFPCGMADGLPMSAQLIARGWEEALLLRVGAALS